MRRQYYVAIGSKQVLSDEVKPMLKVYSVRALTGGAFEYRDMTASPEKANVKNIIY